MRVRCPTCRQFLTAPEEAVGKRGRCRDCNTSFVIEAPPENEEEVSVGEAMAPPRLCPKCAQPMDQGSVLCLSCGFDRNAREVLEVAKPPEEGPPPLPMRALGWLMEYLPGLFRPGILVLAIFLAIVAFAIIGLGLFVVSLGVVIEGMFIAAPGLICLAQAVAIVIYGQWALLSEILADIDGTRWKLFFFLLFSPFAIIYLLLRQFMAH